jgi:hypothetical protein
MCCTALPYLPKKFQKIISHLLITGTCPKQQMPLLGLTQIWPKTANAKKSFRGQHKFGPKEQMPKEL